MTTRFDNKNVLVTGGGSGIGRAIALAFAAEGARVAVAGRTAESLAETVDLVTEQGGSGTATAIQADVQRAEDVSTLIRQTVERLGGLDIAVNNAGILRAGQPLAELPGADWQAMLDTNVTGVLHAMQAEIAHMRDHGGGAIVNVSSNLGAHLRIPGMSGYIATKAAVSALTRAGALDHVHDGVRINAVSPGASATTMSLLPGETEEGRAERLREQSPVGRVSHVEEIAAAVLYLASPQAGSVVGTDLVVDGGASA